MMENILHGKSIVQFIQNNRSFYHMRKSLKVNFLIYLFGYSLLAVAQDANDTSKATADVNQINTQANTAQALPIVPVKNDELSAPTDEQNIIESLSKSAAQYQLNAANEATYLAYLKTKLERVKVQNELKVEQNGGHASDLHDSSIPAINLSGNTGGIPTLNTHSTHQGRYQDSQMPIMPGMPGVGVSGGYEEGSLPKKSNDNLNAIHLLEVSGTGSNLIAKIQKDDASKYYKVGDVLIKGKGKKQKTIEDIKFDRVILNDGTEIFI